MEESACQRSGLLTCKRYSDKMDYGYFNFFFFCSFKTTDLFQD